MVRGGTLVAWATAAGHKPHDGFRIVGAHTDSPNLRIKPQPDVVRAGVRQLGVEAYGGVLLTSWMNRDLGLSGRVAVRRNGTGAMVRLLRVDRPVCAIPQLAIHLDREVNSAGLLVDAQHHLTPLWGIEPPAGTTPSAGTGTAGFVGFVAHELGVDATDVLGWDLMLHDLEPGAVIGRDDELIGSARLDNLAVVLGRGRGAGRGRARRGRGAGADGLPVRPRGGRVDVRPRGGLVAAAHAARAVGARPAAATGEALHRALARSACLSADMAHATHPNYADRHDPEHRIALNGGPVLKSNANVRYATDAPGGALVALAAERAKVPLQRFAMRSDLPCGSTIGPLTAAQLGITTVDVGMPQLAMHSRPRVRRQPRSRAATRR